MIPVRLPTIGARRVSNPAAKREGHFALESLLPHKLPGKEPSPEGTFPPGKPVFGSFVGTFSRSLPGNLSRTIASGAYADTVDG